MDNQAVWDQLKQVSDPEIPVIDIVGLGIVRDVATTPDTAEITITPTYSGCPALEVIQDEIRAAVLKQGFQTVEVKIVRAPAWTTDWMTEETKMRLKEYGIAPPGGAEEALVTIGEQRPVSCPFCESKKTELRSQFGSTACKALHYCNGCLQPFEEFKPF